MDKPEEKVTKEDGLEVLASLRKLITAYTNKMAEMSTSEGLTNIFDTYRNDPGRSLSVCVCVCVCVCLCVCLHEQDGRDVHLGRTDQYL